jgi:hypothetical protein
MTGVRPGTYVRAAPVMLQEQVTVCMDLFVPCEQGMKPYRNSCSCFRLPLCLHIAATLSPTRR